MMNWNLRTCWQALLPWAFLLAADPTAQHVTAGCAQSAANGCFATAALVGPHRAACCTAYTSTNG